MAKVGILQQSPILFASDLPNSIDYWFSKVGFKTNGVWGEPPDFAILTRDNAHLMLSQASAGHEITPHWRVKDKLWNAYFWVDYALELFSELKQSGANMGAVTKKYGAAPTAFIILPLDSAFFVDLVNAFLIGIFVAL